MPATSTLEDIVKHLNRVYCESIGIEYMHISNVEEKNFIRDWINQNENYPVLSVNEKRKFFINSIKQLRLRIFYIPNLLVRNVFP